LVKRHCIEVVQIEKKTEFIGNALDLVLQELDCLGAALLHILIEPGADQSERSGAIPNLANAGR
jgi:hypothetical protein